MENKKVEIFLALTGVIFSLSGFSALLYQIVWQRSLFSVFGVDIESVTLIVTIFMLGLGLGGILGGVLSDRYRSRCIEMFLLCEFFIAIFGYFSIEIIGLIGGTASDLLPVKVGAVLFFPTILMGMTLPLLSVCFVSLGVQVAKVVGKLYFFNTIGAAAACMAAGFVIFNFLGLSGAILIAVVSNIVVVLIGFVLRRTFL